jgi:hypothetical protein
MSNIHGHNSKSIKPSEKVDDNEIKQIVQGVMYSTNQYNSDENSFYHPEHLSSSIKTSSFQSSNHLSASTKQKVRISEDLYLAIKQIVKDELQQFKKTIKHKDYTNEFANINTNFKMLEKEIAKLKRLV